MSASNFSICPRCARRHRDKATVKRREADQAYGNLPLDDWKLLDRDALEAAVEDITRKTFREDWEVFGAEDGEVVFNYGGHCEVCSLHVDIRHTVNIPNGEDV